MSRVVYCCGFRLSMLLARDFQFWFCGQHFCRLLLQVNRIDCQTWRLWFGLIGFRIWWEISQEVVQCCYLSVSAGLRFEVFNLDTKVMMSKTRLHEPIMYWTWLNSDVIGMVTDSAVYHWDLWQGGNGSSKSDSQTVENNKEIQLKSTYLSTCKLSLF